MWRGGIGGRARQIKDGARVCHGSRGHGGGLGFRRACREGAAPSLASSWPSHRWAAHTVEEQQRTMRAMSPLATT